MGLQRVQSRKGRQHGRVKRDTALFVEQQYHKRVLRVGGLTPCLINLHLQKGEPFTQVRVAVAPFKGERQDIQHLLQGYSLIAYHAVRQHIDGLGLQTHKARPSQAGVNLVTVFIQNPGLITARHQHCIPDDLPGLPESETANRFRGMAADDTVGRRGRRGIGIEYNGCCFCGTQVRGNTRLDINIPANQFVVRRINNQPLRSRWNVVQHIVAVFVRFGGNTRALYTDDSAGNGSAGRRVHDPACNTGTTCQHIECDHADSGLIARNNLYGSYAG
ncbi:MAG: hypothetical protein BWY09_03000 [Candidatus Hydrogenedentes bacterium ADurb.Bin179]|nr:MAG: hypothetical protein BWY09_03000 [Candidatus Hydrogenedentes bacterium ADurb.Bin179]